MSAPDRLRELAKAAEGGLFSPNSHHWVENARLIALAPELAKWAADAWVVLACRSFPTCETTRAFTGQCSACHLRDRLDAILADSTETT